MYYFEKSSHGMFYINEEMATFHVFYNYLITCLLEVEYLCKTVKLM